MQVVVHDPKDQARAQTLALSSDHELLGSYPWLSFCQSCNPRSHLFAYAHRVTGRVVMCDWVYTPQQSTVPLALELEGFQDDPRLLWPRDLLHPFVMRERLRPVEESLARYRAQARDKEAREQSARQDNHAQRMNASRYLRRQGLDNAANGLESGAVPFVGSSMSKDNNARMTEEFQRMRRAT